MIKNYLYDRSFMLKMQIAGSVLLFASILSGSFKIMGMGFVQFLFFTFWNMYLMIKGSHVTIKDMVESVEERQNEAFKEKKYFESGIYFLVIPLVGLGLVTIGMMVFIMFVI